MPGPFITGCLMWISNLIEIPFDGQATCLLPSCFSSLLYGSSVLLREIVHADIALCASCKKCWTVEFIEVCEVFFVCINVCAFWTLCVFVCVFVAVCACVFFNCLYFFRLRLLLCSWLVGMLFVKLIGVHQIIC